MKYSIAGIFCLLSIAAQTLEYEVQYENDEVCVAKITIMPHEEIGLHRDVYPRIVFGIKGGTVTRLEADGTTTDVEFPTGKSVFLPAEITEELHRTVNPSSEPIELLIFQLKS